MTKILLIDGNNFIWKGNVAWGNQTHEYNSVTNKCNCGVEWDFEDKSCFSRFVLIYNFFINFRALIEQFKPNKVFFVLEGRPEFRYKLLPSYKANRVKIASVSITRENLFYKHINKIIELLKYLPVTIIRHPKAEADDVINTLSINMCDEDITVISSDSDFIQLLQNSIIKNLKIFNPIKKEFVINPDFNYLGWKCLAGDKKTDNIPGILTPKKAEKTIKDPQLFSKFMSIEENRSLFAINRQLIEFACLDEDELQITEGYLNAQALKDEFELLRFKSLVDVAKFNNFIKTFDVINL